MSGIVLSSAMRTNLSTLQNVTAMQGKIQEKLSTGKKVNSAIDNPTSYFTAASLNRRANDLSALLDGMQQGIKTLEAADNAMKAITKNVETMQANIRSARQDKAFKGVSYDVDATAIGTASAKNLTFSAGSVGTTPVNVALQNAQGVLTGATNYASLDFDEAGDTINFKVALNGSTTTTQVTIEQGTAAESLKITVGGVVTDNIATVDRTTVTGAEMASALSTAFTAANAGISVAHTANKLVFTASAANNASSDIAAVTMSNLVIGSGGAGTAITAANFGFVAGGVGVSAGGTASTTGLVAKTVDQLVSSVNNNTSLTNKVKASNDGGKLRLENLSTEDLTVVGGTSTTVNGGTGGANTSTIRGNESRKALISQFNELRKQLDKLAGDATYNGVNLVKADKLKVVFNEGGTSTVEIQAKNVTGVVRGIGTEAISLDIAAADATEFSDDAALDARLDKLADAITTIQTQSSEFGAALSTVQNRQEFTKSMINTLQTGADALTLADANEEAAKLLSLNTRQSLSQTALSLASQADQAVLKLF